MKGLKKDENLRERKTEIGIKKRQTKQNKKIGRRRRMKKSERGLKRPEAIKEAREAISFHQAGRARCFAQYCRF